MRRVQHRERIWLCWYERRGRWSGRSGYGVQWVLVRRAKCEWRRSGFVDWRSEFVLGRQWGGGVGFVRRRG